MLKNENDKGEDLEENILWLEKQCCKPARI